MKQSSREQEKELQNLRKTKDDLFKAAFNVVKIVEYYRNSGYTDKLKQALAEENVIWARKNISLYNLLKNEHTRIINQLKEYGVRKGMGGDGGKVATFLNKYTATIRKKTNVVAGTQRLFSAEKSKNIIYDRQTLPGHRPIRSDDIKTGEKVRGRQPLYDLNADRLLNIERYLGVYSEKLPSTKKREDELSKYGEMVNAYRELAIADDDKQDPWTGLAMVDKFDYKQLPEDIKKVIEFWRRNYGEDFDIELDDNIMDAGLEARKATWVKNNDGNCNDLLNWENDNFRQFISEHGKTCLEKQSQNRVKSIEQSGCYNFDLLFNSVGSKNYDRTLKKLMPFVEKCSKENQYDKVDGLAPPPITSDKSDEGEAGDAPPGVKVTSRDLGNQGELIFKIKFDKAQGSSSMIGDIGSNNRYYWKELQSVLNKMNAEANAKHPKVKERNYKTSSKDSSATDHSFGSDSSFGSQLLDSASAPVTNDPAPSDPEPAPSATEPAPSDPEPAPSDPEPILRLLTPLLRLLLILCLVTK